VEASSLRRVSPKVSFTKGDVMRERDENLAEILNRVVFAADWQRGRAERHGRDAEDVRTHPDYNRVSAETRARWEGTEIGAQDARRDSADTLHSIAVALARVLGTEVPSADMAREAVLARAKSFA